MRWASAASKWGPRRTLCGGRAAGRSGRRGPGLCRVADKFRARGSAASINSAQAALNSSHVRSRWNLSFHSVWNWWTSSRAASDGSLGAAGRSGSACMSGSLRGTVFSGRSCCDWWSGVAGCAGGHGAVGGRTGPRWLAVGISGVVGGVMAVGDEGFCSSGEARRRGSVWKSVRSSVSALCESRTGVDGSGESWRCGSRLLLIRSARASPVEGVEGGGGGGGGGDGGRDDSK